MKPLLHEAINDKKIDVRLAEKNIQRQLITAEEFEKAKASLKDDSDHATIRALDEIALDDGGPLKK